LVFNGSFDSFDSFTSFRNRPKRQKEAIPGINPVKRRGFIWEAVLSCFSCFEQKEQKEAF